MHTSHVIPLANRPPLVLGRTALLMGILNVTPDSFSDGGRHNLVEAAVAHAHLMIAEGADIIDIGGESTRPGADPVGTQEELDRVMPVIDALIGAGITTPISIDTYKPLVADQAIQAGAVIINDVHGLQGAREMANIAALHQVPVIVMHSDQSRNPAIPIATSIASWFGRSIRLALAAGITSDRLIIDPGFGFFKSPSENYAALKQLAGISQQICQHAGSMPVLVGTSRKSMIGKLLNVPADQRLSGTIATTVLGYINGGHIFRVHDVRANRDALRVAEATLYGPPETLE